MIHIAYLYMVHEQYIFLYHWFQHCFQHDSMANKTKAHFTIFTYKYNFWDLMLFIFCSHLWTQILLFHEIVLLSHLFFTINFHKNTINQQHLPYIHHTPFYFIFLFITIKAAFNKRFCLSYSLSSSLYLLCIHTNNFPT